MSHHPSNLEARARALAEHVLRRSYIGNAVRHAKFAEMVGPENMPKLLSESELIAEVDRDWPLYAELIEDGVA